MTHNIEQITEAIYLLENIIGRLEANHGANYNKALRMGIESLEKQIPKKPSGSFDDETYGKAYVCECTGIIDEYQKFCPSCGQALNWEGVFE